MLSSDNTPKKPVPGAKTADQPVRVKDVERDTGAILRRAASGPVRITAKVGPRALHIATIRRGEKSDPAGPASLPVAIVALKRRAGRILHLASALQVVLRVKASPTSAGVFFIEPGGDCLEFATQRLGGTSRDAALLKTALRRTPIARAASEAAARQADARRQNEVKSLHGRIAALERDLKKRPAVAKAKRRAIAARPQPAPELAPADKVESGPVAT